MCVIQDIREYTNCIKKIMFIHLYLVTPLYYSIYAYVCSFNSTQKTKDELKKQSFIHFRTLILLLKMHPSQKIHKSIQYLSTNIFTVRPQAKNTAL